MQERKIKEKGAWSPMTEPFCQEDVCKNCKHKITKWNNSEYYDNRWMHQCQSKERHFYCHLCYWEKNVDMNGNEKLVCKKPEPAGDVKNE